MPHLINDAVIGGADDTLYTSISEERYPAKLETSLIEKLAEDSPIWAARGKAVQMYALLECSLSELVAHLGNMDSSVASLLFFKNTSSASRISIIETLLRKKYSNDYNVFWNSFLRSLRPIDTKRNEIVHWVSVATARPSLDGFIEHGVVLVPPQAKFGSFGKQPHNTYEDILAFSEKCYVYRRLCANFVLVMTEPHSHPNAASWLEIFRQPLVYPLPEGHLLNELRAAQ